MELRKVFGGTVKISDQIGGEKYSFTVKKSGLTPMFMQHLVEMPNNPINYARALACVVTDWDLTLDGEPFPPTEENLRNAPTEFLDRMLLKIKETWTEAEQEQQ